MPRARTAKLRAINRAPEFIRGLYDKDLLAVDLAAKFGPAVKDETQGQAVRAEMDGRAEAMRQRLEAFTVFRPDTPQRQLKREMNKAARELLAVKQDTPLEKAQRLFNGLDRKAKERFVAWVNQQGW